MNTIKRWTAEQANEWYARQPWLVGCNFIPSTAINQLEIWQAETFDPITIDRELGWAASAGFNTVRTYLHDLAWEADAEGFKNRLDAFLEIACRHGTRPILVIFDDCWNSNPKMGLQPAPKPRVHNSGWVQSPSNKVSHQGPPAWSRLERYVRDVISTFAGDPRVLLWDLYNEPGNSNNGSRSLPLLEAVFAWARDVNPSQPLSAGIWFDNAALNEFQLAASDVITFHNYNPADNLEREIRKLKAFGRPIICTEWMARACGSLVSTNLPVFAREKVGCLNWGLVSGKTNTIYPWEVMPSFIESANWSKEKQDASTAWFHDLFHADGAPYDTTEIELFRKYTSKERGIQEFPA